VKAPGVAKVFRLMLPVVLGLSLPGVYGLITQALGSYYQDGINTALDLANKLMQAPLGIFGQSLALAVFPALTQFFAQQRMDMFRNQLSSTLRTVIFLTVPVSLAMFLLAPEIVAVAFQYGKARTADLPALAACLRMFSFGIFAWCLHPVLMRAFFAVQQTVAPIVLGTIATAIFLVLVYTLKATTLGYLALPLASSISAISLVILLTAAVRRHIGGLEIMPILSTLGKSVLASLPFAAFLFVGIRYVPQGEGVGRNLWAAVKIVGVGTAAAWAYYYSARLLRMSEAETISRALNRKTKREPVE
jgi:putative peptidoglycan lipid II flippase